MNGADADGLLKNNPGDALQQGRRGQGTIVGPVVQTRREEDGWIEVREGGLLSLEGEKRRRA